MSSQSSVYDAVVIGAGPNGLAAAITLAHAGHSVIVFEASDVIGGGSRSKELTLPGYIHDVCSAIHPLRHWFAILSDAAAGAVWSGMDSFPGSLGAPAARWSRGDAGALVRGDWHDPWPRRRCLAAALRAARSPHWDSLAEGILAPLRPLRQFKPPFTSLAMARFGLYALQSARGLAERTFTEDQRGRSLSGMAAHSMLPLEQAADGGGGHADVDDWRTWLAGRWHGEDRSASWTRWRRTCAILGGEIVTGAVIAPWTNCRRRGRSSAT